MPFITFEGSEGCGKSTQVERLASRLKLMGVPLLVTREPGGTVIGEKIRELLQYTPQASGMTAETELLLFQASRSQLVREIIEPGIKRGTCVISDRFFDSTTAYQGAARKLAMETVDRLNRFAVGDCIPDITFILELDPEIARTRMLRRVRPVGPDRMEQEPAEFYQRVSQAYRDLAAREPERCRLVDGVRPIEEVEAEIWKHLSPWFDTLATKEQSAGKA